MLKANQIQLLKKIGMIFLATLLCFLLIFNTCINIYAVAGVDDALFLLLASILASCGISFASAELAEAGTSALYENMDTGTQSMVDTVATQLKQELLANTAVASIGVSFFKSGWDNIIKAIAVTFGTYMGIDTAINLTSSLSDSLPIISNPNQSITFEYTAGPTIATQYTIGNTVISFIGSESGCASVPNYIDFDTSGTRKNGVLCLVSIANGLFVKPIKDMSNQAVTYSGTIDISYSSSMKCFLSQGTNIFLNGYFMGNQMSHPVLSASQTSIFANGSNIVQNGYLIGTDIAVPDSICPDGIWNNKGLAEWLDDLAFGTGSISFPGNPSIDAPCMPGNDVWHDGSINDDIAVGNPTIGIAVPTTGDDVISLNPDIARDYTGTDTKLGDIAGDTTGDTTGDSSGDTTGNPPKNGNTGALPALSLPEMLFKEKFPFCLPWDLYSLFLMLQAEPKVPKFEIPFINERLGINESITIDFSQYEEQVEIIRFFIGAGFVLALILISRKMIGAD